MPTVTYAGKKVAVEKVNGKFITKRVQLIIEDAAKAAKVPVPKVMQGSFNRGVGASAGTHDGGGAFDISIINLTSAQQVALAEELRRRNVCYWIRTKKYGWNGAPHGHGIVRDEPLLAPTAKKQLVHYDNKNNALAGASRRVDTLPRPTQLPIEKVLEKEAQKMKLKAAGFKVGSMYKTPLTKPLKLVARKDGYDVAVVDLPADQAYLLTFQARTLKGVTKPLEAEFVRLGWGAEGQATDETGHNPFEPASKAFDVWHRWRTLNHEIKGGGKVAFRVFIPEGATGEYRFVCKAEPIA